MKRVYWRPNKISKPVLLCLGLIAVGGTLALEARPWTRDFLREQKQTAAELAAAGMAVIRDARLAKGHVFDTRFDPTASGMIGEAMSPVTSLPSHLDVKQTSVNPNFAAAVVEMLAAAGVQRGDVVAVGCTGSFPAFNTGVFAALETLGAKPLVIHSAASSQFGANRPDMMWLDMESVLYEAGLISFRSQAATLGAFGDRARGMAEESKRLLRDSIERNDVRLLDIKSLAGSIEQRMEFYNKQAAGREVTAYINVGGGAASIHGSSGRAAFGAGLTTDFDGDAEAIDCVAARYAEQGVPVIHVGDAVALAKQFGLQIAPQSAPAINVAAVGVAQPPSRLLAAALLAAIAFFLRSYLWSDLWLRLSQRVGSLFQPNREESPDLRIAGSHAVELMV